MTQKIDLGNVRGKTGQRGKDGLGITDISRTGRDGLVDTYTITYSDGHTTEFTVTSIDSAEVVDGILEYDDEDDDKVPSVKAVRLALQNKVGSDYAYGKSASDDRYVKATDVGETVSPKTHTHGMIQSDGKIGTTGNASKNVVTDANGNISLESKPSIDSSMSSSSTRAVQNKAIKSYVDSKVFEAQTNNQITIETELLEDSTNPVQSNAIYSALSDGLSTHTHEMDDITDIAFGTTSGTFCEGNDSRLSDARVMKSTLITATDSNDTNIDNFLTTGLFHFFNNATIQYVQGTLPSTLGEKSFYLCVHARNNNEVKQTLTRFDNGMTWVRVKQSGNWTAWKGVSNEGHTHTKSNITDFSHSHGYITNDGKLGSTSNKPLITGTNGTITTGSFGTTANTFCQGNDSRLSNSRKPISHASSGDDYGLGTSDMYGHCKVIDNLTTVNSEDGEALSAYQGHMMDGTATLGSETSRFARGDHVHPRDTTKQDKSAFVWEQLGTTIVSRLGNCKLYANDYFCYAIIDLTLSNQSITTTNDYYLQSDWIWDDEYKPPFMVTSVSEEGAGGREILVKLNTNGDLLARSLHQDYNSTSFHIVCSLFYPRFSI